MLNQSEESANPEIFDNDEISVQVNLKPNCEAELDIVVKEKSILSLTQVAFKNIKKEISIPGFRKGHAPDKFIQDKFEVQIAQETRDVILQYGIDKALKLTNLFQLPKTQLHVSNFKWTKGEDASFKLALEVYPTIPKIDLNSIEIQKRHLKIVTDQDVEEELNAVQEHYTTYEPVTGKMIQKGDFAQFFLETVEEFPQPLTDVRILKVTDELPSSLLHLLEGATAGTKIERLNPATLEQVEESTEDLSLVTLVIEDVVERIAPVIDDAFAIKNGASSLEDMKEKIRNIHEKRNKQELLKSEMNDIKTFLIEKHSFDLPKKSLAKSLNETWESYIEDVENEKGPLSAEDRNNLQTQFLRQQENMIRYETLIHPLIIEHKLEPTNDEVTEETKFLLEDPDGLHYLMSQQNKSGEMQNYLYRKAKERKIHSFLLEHTRYID